VVAIVVRYADNILKGFATSISILVSVIVSMIWLGWQPTWGFVIGATLVMGSTYVYGREEAAKSTTTMGKGKAVDRSGYTPVEYVNGRTDKNEVIELEDFHEKGIRKMAGVNETWGEGRISSGGGGSGDMASFNGPSTSGHRRAASGGPGQLMRPLVKPKNLVD